MFLTKYKIKSNIDLCFNIKANNTLNLISQNNSVQNIIIYGPNGSGKKTLIDLFLNIYLNFTIKTIHKSILNLKFFKIIKIDKKIT